MICEQWSDVQSNYDSGVKPDWKDFINDLNTELAKCNVGTSSFYFLDAIVTLVGLLATENPTEIIANALVNSLQQLIKVGGC